MTNPTLPLIDGCFLFDNSSLETFQQCPYAYQLAHIRRRILDVDAAGMNFGSACHNALKIRYTTYGSGKCENTSNILASLEQHFQQHPEPPGDHRNLNMATEWFSAYNKVYATEPFKILTLDDGKLFIERSFMQPFGCIINGQMEKTTIFDTKNVKQWVARVKGIRAIPVFFTGRIDLGIGDNSGEWLIDHKSAFMFGKNFTAEMTSSPQFRGYGWEFQNFYGRPPKGYIINAFRVRPPTKKAQYDTSDLFRINGADPDFQRIVVEFTPNDISDWEQNTFGLLEEVLWHYSRSTFGKHKKNCVGKYGPCQFYDLCNSVAPEHQETYLAGNTFKDNVWTPLNVPVVSEVKQ